MTTDGGDDAYSASAASDNSSIVEISIPTLTLAVAWLSLVKSTPPIEAYMQMALDYRPDDDDEFEGSSDGEGSESGSMFQLPGSSQFSRPKKKTAE